MIKKAMSGVAVLLVAAATVVAAEVNLEGVKCVVAPKAASASKAVDYKGGKVYMCCGGCVGKFKSNTAKYAEKANHQLVATKQFAHSVVVPLTKAPLLNWPARRSDSAATIAKANSQALAMMPQR